MMTTVTRRRTCKRRRAGPEKRRTIEDVGKENGVEEGEGNDSLIAEIGVVVVVLLTILLIAVISKIKIKLKLFAKCVNHTQKCWVCRCLPNRGCLG